jgi:hypothetical protein
VVERGSGHKKTLENQGLGVSQVPPQGVEHYARNAGFYARFMMPYGAWYAATNQAGNRVRQLM